jgi:hypothetical protein
MCEPQINFLEKELVKLLQSTYQEETEQFFQNTDKIIDSLRIGRLQIVKEQEIQNDVIQNDTNKSTPNGQDSLEDIKGTLNESKRVTQQLIAQLQIQLNALQNHNYPSRLPQQWRNDHKDLIQKSISEMDQATKDDLLQREQLLHSRIDQELVDNKELLVYIESAQEELKKKMLQKVRHQIMQPVNDLMEGIDTNNYIAQHEGNNNKIAVLTEQRKELEQQVKKHQVVINEHLKYYQGDMEQLKSTLKETNDDFILKSTEDFANPEKIEELKEIKRYVEVIQKWITDSKLDEIDFDALKSFAQQYESKFKDFKGFGLIFKKILGIADDEITTWQQYAGRNIFEKITTSLKDDKKKKTDFMKIVSDRINYINAKIKAANEFELLRVTKKDLENKLEKIWDPQEKIKELNLKIKQVNDEIKSVEVLDAQQKAVSKLDQLACDIQVLMPLIDVLNDKIKNATEQERQYFMSAFFDSSVQLFDADSNIIAHLQRRVDYIENNLSRLANHSLSGKFLLAYKTSLYILSKNIHNLNDKLYNINFAKDIQRAQSQLSAMESGLEHANLDGILHLFNEIISKQETNITNLKFRLLILSKMLPSEMNPVLNLFTEIVRILSTKLNAFADKINCKLKINVAKKEVKKQEKNSLDLFCNEQEKFEQEERKIIREKFAGKMNDCLRHVIKPSLFQNLFNVKNRVRLEDIYKLFLNNLDKYVESGNADELQKQIADYKKFGNTYFGKLLSELENNVIGLESEIAANKTLFNENGFSLPKTKKYSYLMYIDNNDNESIKAKVNYLLAQKSLQGKNAHMYFIDNSSTLSYLSLKDGKLQEPEKINPKPEKEANMKAIIESLKVQYHDKNTLLFKLSAENVQDITSNTSHTQKDENIKNRESLFEHRSPSPSP